MSKKSNAANYSWQDAIKCIQEQFHNSFKELKKSIKIWRDNHLRTKQDGSDKSILLQYVKYLKDYNDIDCLKGYAFIQKIYYRQELKNITEQKKIFLGIPFLFHKEWRINFGLKFISKTSLLKQSIIIDTVFKLYLIAEGYMNFSPGRFNFLKPYEKVSKYRLNYYTNKLQIEDDVHLVFSIGVFKFPQYESQGGRLSSFQFIYMVTCEDIIHQNIFHNQKKMNAVIESLENSYDQDPRLKYAKEELVLNEASINKKLLYYNDKKKGDNQQILTKIYPTNFTKQKNGFDKQAQLQEYEDFQFLLQRYTDYQTRAYYMLMHQISNAKNTQNQDTLGDHLKAILLQQLELQTSKNQKLQFTQNFKLLDNLQKIPNFKYSLTNQQRQLLCSGGNLIVAGRSGTGKTTCAMLRLYGIEFSIKMKEYNNLRREKKVEQDQSRCTMMVLDEIKLTKNIFLTFSSILIEQIKNQYDDMIHQIKGSHSKKCKICSKRQNTLQSNYFSEDPIDRIKRIRKQQQQKVISLGSIQVDDFPGFFTIQNFIKVIDKSTERPFFSQEHEHNNKGQIKFSYVNYYEYSFNEINLVQTVKAVYVDYQFFLKHIWQHLPKQLTKTTKDFCLLTSSIVWSQIISILKGSLFSYLCPHGFISLKMYLQNSQSIFQNQQRVKQYKRKVYKIFKSYVAWCKDEKGFDLMDVVNHNLRQIQFYGYNGPRINYMFIDEVQDLTASTTLLISKMVINNVFYCGDTAQAITKGVAFRFEDLKFLFNKQHFKNSLELQCPQQTKNLTVNFRSHNFILQLANSITSSLQSLFPGSINKMKQQKSDLLGPKPFLILSDDQSIILQLICSQRDLGKEQADTEMDLIGLMKQSQAKSLPSETKEISYYSSSSTKDPKKLNSQQVVIVRNQSQIDDLPPQLREGIVLTPEKAKGLQYDEIILYNFFETCQIYDKWNLLLQHLQCIQEYQDQKQFQEQLSRRDQQQKNQINNLSMKTKILLGYDQRRKQYKNWTIKSKESINGISTNLFHQIATELKILYTVITRARSVFVLFDTRIPKNLLKLWQKMGLITVINQSNLWSEHNQIKEYVKINEKHLKYINQQQRWFKAGEQMLARNDYRNAKKCFKKIKRIDLAQRIDAMDLERNAQNQLYRIQSEVKKISKFQGDDRKIVKARLQRQKKQAFKLYSDAGKIFQHWKRYNDAAEAYFKGENYESALKNYQLANDERNQNKIATCFKRLKYYKDALKIFSAIEDTESIIECYIEEKNWKTLLSYISSHSNNIERNKYVSIVLKSLKNIMKEIFNSTQIIKQREYFQRYHMNQIKQYQQLKQQIYDEDQFSQGITRIVMEFSYRNLKKSSIQLQDKRNKFQQLKSNIMILQGQLQKIEQLITNLQYDQLELNTKKDQIHQKKTQIKNLIEKQKDEQCIAQLEKELNQLEIKRLQFYQKGREIKYSKQVRSQMQITKQLQFARLKNQLSKEKLVYKHIDKQIAFCNQALKQTIKLYQQKYINEKQISSLTQISQIQKALLTSKRQVKKTKQFKFQSMLIKKQTKIKMILEIQSYFQQFSQLIQNNFETPTSYDIYHHKYLINILFKFLEQNSQKNAGLLRKLYKIGQNMAGILICNQYPQLNCVSLYFILNHTLEFSKNSRKKRSLEKQATHSHISNGAELSQQDIQIKAGVRKFQIILALLDNDRLQYKIPRMGFENKVYYQTIVSQLIYGLILQGYFKQALMFCENGMACKLAYIFSSYGKMMFYVKRIAKKQKDKIKFGKQDYYLFISNEKVLDQYDVRVINVFSIQKIIFSYDECRSQPFFSKQKQAVQFEIDQDTVNKFYNDINSEKYEKVKEMHRKILKEIKQQKESVAQLQKQKERGCQSKQYYDNLYEDRLQEFYLQRDNLVVELQNSKRNLQQLRTKYSRASFQINQYKISKKVKIQKEKQINELQKLIQSLQVAQRISHVSRLNDLNEEYQKKLWKQKQSLQAYQNAEKQMKEQQKQIGNINNRLLQINGQIRTHSQAIKYLPLQQIKKDYDNRIKEKHKRIEQLTKNLPKDMDLNDQQRLTELIVKERIQQQKYKKHTQYLQKERQQKMSLILNSSNIPNDSRYQFLKIYISGGFYNSLQFSHKEYSMIISILVNGAKIQQLQAQSNRQIQLCNIIIFYLTYINNIQFSKQINHLLEEGSRKFQGQVQRAQQLKRQIQYLQRQLSFREYSIQFTRVQRSRIKLLEIEKNQLIQRINFLKNQLKKVKFSSDPRKLLVKFLSSVFKKIQSLSSSEMSFLQLLFGFYQCRIIRQCQILDFLANQYVLVKHNSIVIQRIRKMKSPGFAYYFDQDNTVILCRFLEVQQVILSIIRQKHSKVTHIQNVFNSNKNKYMNAQIIGFSVKQDSTRFYQIAKIVYSNEQRNVAQMYQNNFKESKLMKNIKQAKKRILKYYLGSKFQDSDSYLFSSHQLQEYYFLQKILANMKTFNYDLLKQVLKKAQKLEEEYKKYTNQ